MKAKTIYLVYSERDIIAAFTDKHKAYLYLEYCKITDPADTTLHIEEHICKDNAVSSRAGVRKYFAVFLYFIYHKGKPTPVYVETEEYLLSDKDEFVTHPKTGDMVLVGYSLKSFERAKEILLEASEKLLTKRRK